MSLGVFVNGSDVNLRVDGDNGEIGTEIDWSSEFGNVDLSRFRLDGTWRINDRHHIRGMYTDYSRAEERTLQRDIEWDGEIIPVGVDAQAKIGFKLLEVAYEYAFMHSENFELAGSAGLHYTDITVALRADVTTPGGVGTVERGGSESVALPLPVFGLRGLWHMGGDFYLDGQAQWFALELDKYDGKITNFRGAVIWQPSKWIGIGAGYDYFKIDLGVDGDSGFNGQLDWTYSGPQIFWNVAL